MSKTNRTVDRIQAIWNMIGGDDVVDNLLAGRLTMTIEVPANVMRMTSVSFEIGNHTPCGFFKERDGLSMSPEFSALVQSATSNEDLSIDTKSVTIGYGELLREVGESEIVAQLPKDYVFGELNTFFVYLASLIFAQWEGEQGALKTNGDINIFFVQANGETQRIWVQYQPRYKKWRCVTIDTVDGFKSRRIFSAAA